MARQHLESYYAHVDTCLGKYSHLKANILDAGGFNIHACLDTFQSQFRLGGSLSVTQWYQKSAHRYFIILKNCLELSVAAVERQGENSSPSMVIN